MKFILSLLLLFGATDLIAQQNISTENMNGVYHLLVAERGAANGGTTNEKLIQFGENNGTKLLAIAACEKCMPAVYTYQEDDSKRLGMPVFFNSSGLYVLEYDEDSLVTVLVTNKLGDGEWTDFSFSNFYSKNEAKVNAMTKEKIEAYAISISKK